MSIIAVEDADRLAENLWSTYGEAIHSQETFNEKFDELIDPSEAQNRDLRPAVFNEYVKNHEIAGRIESETFGKEPAKQAKKRRVTLKKLKHKFKYSGYIKQRLVYARPTKINQRYKKKGVEYRKPQVKFRDSKGRFVKLFGKTKINPEKL